MLTTPELGMSPAHGIERRPDMKHTRGPFTVQQCNHAEGQMWLQIGFFDPRDRTREIGPIAELKYLITRDEEQRANAELLSLAPTAPHDCDLDCPGAVNKRKLEALPEMLEALEAAEQHYAMLCEVICTDNPPPGGHPVLLRLRA